MRIAVCDDDQLYIEMLKEGIRDWQKETEAANVFIASFLSAEALLASVHDHKTFDLYFLDIDFGARMNGYELARELRRMAPEAMLIFVTNYDTYLKEGYELNILRYFNKPVPREKLTQVLDLCAAKLKEKEQAFAVRISDNERPLPADTVLSIEYSDHRLLVHTLSGVRSVRTRESFTDFCRKLPDTVFLRCHQSFLVNMNHVNSFSSASITLDDASEVPISRSYREEVVLKLRRFFTGAPL